MRSIKNFNLETILWLICKTLNQDLEFCTESVLLRSIKEIVENQIDFRNNPDNSYLADEHRKIVCQLLARLFIASQDEDCPKW